MTKQQIGAAARKARGARSIRSVARDAGITQGQVKGIEEASKAYTVDTLLALGKAIGLRLQFLQAKVSEAAFTKGSDGSDDVQGEACQERIAACRWPRFTNTRTTR